MDIYTHKEKMFWQYVNLKLKEVINNSLIRLITDMSERLFDTDEQN